MKVAEYLTVITVTYYMYQNPVKSSSFKFKPETTRYYVVSEGITTSPMKKSCQKNPSHLNLVMLEF